MGIESVYIEITNRCNLDCRDCYNSSGKNRESVELSPDVIDRFIKQVIDINTGNKSSEKSNLRINFSGGEPLLYSCWDDIMDIAEKYSESHGVNFSVVTNGTLYNERLYNLLSSNEKFYVQFSLDGCDEETNALTRGKGNFEIVVDKIKNNSFKIPPILKMVVSQYNKNQVEDYYRFACGLGCTPNFAFINHMGNAVSEWEDKTISPLEKVNIVNKIVDLDEEFGINSYPPYITLSCPLSDADSPRSLLVKPNGDIQPCQLFYSGSYKLENINNFDLVKYSNSINDLAELIKLREAMDFGCKNCICGSQCGRGCPALAVSAHNELNTSDSLCLYRKTQFARNIFQISLKKESC